MTLDIMKAGGDKPYGGEELGTVLIVPKEHLVSVTANMSAPPAEGKVFEVGLSTMEVLVQAQSRRVFKERYTYIQ